MKKNVFIYILLAFLIVVNGFFLFNYLGKPGNKGPKGPESFIVKELKFDTDQMEQFKLLNDKHHTKMRSILDEKKVLKDALFDNISKASINKQEIDSLIVLLGNIEQNLETAIFYNLRAIQNLCNDEQKKRFINIVKDARHQAEGPPQNGPQNGPPKR